MKQIKKLLTVVMMTALVFTVMVPQAADDVFAASKKYVMGQLVGDTDLEYAMWTKVNGGYYTSISKYSESDWSLESSSLYYKASADGKAKKIYTAPEGYEIGTSFVTNGSKVYLTSYAEGKFKIHQASTSGKTKKTLKTKSVESDAYAAKLFNVYGGRIYVALGNGDLYTYTIETKKFSRVKKSFGTPYSHTGESTYTAQSRYIYGTGYTEEDVPVIAVYDCKNKKTIRTIKNAYAMKLYDGKVSFLRNNDGVVSLYKGSVTGKDAKAVYTFPADAEVVRGHYDNKVYDYFSVYDEASSSWKYSKFSLDTLEVESSTQEEYDYAVIASYAGPFA